MVDIIRTVKSIMDAHGAWVFGGAIAASLVAHQAKKRRSFGADWFQVTCYGCGRAGFSDEFEEVTTPQGREAHQCIRCRRPDIFKQAEGGHPSIDDDYYQVKNHQCPRCKSMVTESDSCGSDCAQCWACGCDCDAIIAARIINDETARNIKYPAKIITDDSHDYEVDDYILIVDGTIREVAGNPQMDFFENDNNDWDQYQIAVITSVDPYTVEIVDGRYGNQTRAAEDTDPCPHCDGAAGFPREFYYQSDRIEMVPCGTCLTQGRCPGCMELYSNLSRDNTPEDVFFGSGCTRCGYSESDAREARKTARRWVELVDNPAAAKFMEAEAETVEANEFYVHSADEMYGPYYSLADAEDAVDRLSGKGIDIRGITLGKSGYYLEAEDDLEMCHICGDRAHTDTVEIQVCDKHTASDYGLFYPDHWEGDAEDYGVGAVWMADSYDAATHGNLLPMGSVKRFLASMPVSQKFHVDFVKSNGEIRSMDAVLTKPYDPDSRTADVLEITNTGTSFKRFRVDRVFVLYRV